MTKLWLVLGAVFIAFAAFGAGILVDRSLLVSSGLEVPPQPNQQPNKLPTERRHDAFVEFLNGKTIVLEVSQDSKEKGDVHPIRKSEIGAVEFPQTMMAMAGEPFQADIKLILNTVQGRYLVYAKVPYNQFGEEYFFRGFEVKEVVKQ